MELELHFGTKLELKQGDPDPKWVDHLVLVIAQPHRLLGLVDGDLPEDGESFLMEHVCVYASQIGFQQMGEGQIQVGGHRLVIPFDGVAPLRNVRIIHYAGLVRINDEPKESKLRQLLVGGYLGLFEPSQLILANQPKLVEPK